MLDPARIEEMRSFREMSRHLLSRMLDGGLRCGRQYESIIRSKLDESIGHKVVGEITADDCALVIGGMERRGNAPRTRLRTRSLMHRLFEECVRDGLIQRNPVPGLSGCNVDSDPWWRELQRFEPEEVAIVGARDASRSLVRRLQSAIWRFAYATGARISEISGASWSSLDMTRKPLPNWRILAAYNTCDRVIREPKTRAPRLSPLNADAQAAIADASDLWPLLVGRPFRNEDPIFPVVRYRGGCVTQIRKPRSVRRLRNDTAWHWLEKNLAEANMRRRGTHAFRASFISTLLEAGTPESMVLALTHPRGSGGDPVLRGYLRPRYAALCEIVGQIKIPPTTTKEGQLRLPFT